jgi:hypothetical protein
MDTDNTDDNTNDNVLIFLTYYGLDINCRLSYLAVS